MERRIRLILHGKSADDSEVVGSVSRLRNEGHTLEVRVTWEAGDPVWMAREAAEKGVETVVAHSGDSRQERSAPRPAQRPVTRTRRRN